MHKVDKKCLLIFLIFTFSFVYRIILMHWETFPSGADIGLHNSVVYSVTSSGNTNFLWNFYQFGGRVSLTFPGYHIFVSNVMMLTGLPDFTAHSIVSSLFSSLIALGGFLITRTIWRESAAFIVAFLVAVSRFDVEILLWGGYPNTITLLLIPLVFYLYLERDRFSFMPFLVATSILSASIFLTHSLSASIFVGITIVTVLFVIIHPKLFGASRKHMLNWLLPIILGIIIISPFLVNAIPIYLEENSTIAGGEMDDIQLALLSTRILPFDIILPLFACVSLFFLLSKKYSGRFVSLPAFLLSMWLFVPLLLTQGYIFGLYIDYSRFIYFILLPVMMLIAMFIDHGSAFFAKVIDTYRSLTIQLHNANKTANKVIMKVSSCLPRKNIYIIFVISLLFYTVYEYQVFLTPNEGITVQGFYQVMTNPGYETIMWAKQNTPSGSLFVADAEFGWWVSGFAQRPTLSAVDPQFLILDRELAPALFARYLLDTNYVIDNGFIQIRHDGGYIARHNPLFLVKLNNTYFPYPFLNFDNSLIRISTRIEDRVRVFDVSELFVRDMALEYFSNHANIVIRQGNDFLNYTQIITVQKGEPWVNMIIRLESDVDTVSIESISFYVQSEGYRLNTSEKDTVVLFDEEVNASSYIIFIKEQPIITDLPVKSRDNKGVFDSKKYSLLELTYDLQEKTEKDLHFCVFFSVTDDPIVYKDRIRQNSELNTLINAKKLFTFDYQRDIKERDVSYIVIRYPDTKTKFMKDPFYNLVFINDEISIFKVK